MSRGNAPVASIILESIPAEAGSLGVISAVPFALQTRVAFHAHGQGGGAEGSTKAGGLGMSFSTRKALSRPPSGHPVSEANEVRAEPRMVHMARRAPGTWVHVCSPLQLLALFADDRLCLCVEAWCHQSACVCSAGPAKHPGPSVFIPMARAARVRASQLPTRRHACMHACLPARMCSCAAQAVDPRERSVRVAGGDRSMRVGKSLHSIANFANSVANMTGLGGGGGGDGGQLLAPDMRQASNLRGVLVQRSVKSFSQNLKKVAVELFAERVETDHMLLIHNNALALALNSRSSECVQVLLDHVAANKVSWGSYHAITDMLPSLAIRYPIMCHQVRAAHGRVGA